MTIIEDKATRLDDQHRHPPYLYRLLSNNQHPVHFPCNQIHITLHVPMPKNINFHILYISESLKYNLIDSLSLSEK